MTRENTCYVILKFMRKPVRRSAGTAIATAHTSSVIIPIRGREAA